MLATETQAIADYFKQLMITQYGLGEIKNHFADTRDTLCYATNDNQDATYQLLETDADLAIVVGGYNSSNTSHLRTLRTKFLPILSLQKTRFFQTRDQHSISQAGKNSHRKLPARKKSNKNYPDKWSLMPGYIIDRVLLRCWISLRL